MEKKAVLLIYEEIRRFREAENNENTKENVRGVNVFVRNLENHKGKMDSKRRERIVLRKRRN